MIDVTQLVSKTNLRETHFLKSFIHSVLAYEGPSFFFPAEILLKLKLTFPKTSPPLAIPKHPTPDPASASPLKLTMHHGCG